jgi:argonaute-like protein
VYNGYILPPVRFAFGSNRGTDKFRGLQEFGPYGALDLATPVRFGFVFPTGYNNFANQLYLALKNGIGYFRGVESAFRFGLRKDQVFPITGFSVPDSLNSHDAARSYTDAILTWIEQNRERPDLFFILHPRTPTREGDTPYYRTKAALLSRGILSQSVTFDLLQDSSVFNWSVANIALAAFVKLGGVPWLLDRDESDQDLIIGVGRADVFDPKARSSIQHIGYTACFSSRGEFKFLTLADVARTDQERIASLKRVVGTSIDRLEQANEYAASVTLHLPKELNRDERRAVTDTLENRPTKAIYQLSAVKVSDEASYFAVDENSEDGIPSRGTVIQTTDHDFMLYTEGREEKQSWRKRLPSALRVSTQTEQVAPSHTRQLIRQVHDLSQVNWRAFNARSRPISILYGELIAKILSHVPQDAVNELYKDEARRTLEERMWFI